MVSRLNRPSAPPGLPVEQAATLPGILFRGLKGGPDAVETMSRAEKLLKEGASLKDIFEETGKLANPAEETGLRLTPDRQWVFDITDKDAKITPYAEGQLSQGSRSLGGVPLGTAYRHDLLYDRVPGMKDVPVDMWQAAPGSGDVLGGSYTFGDQNNPLGEIGTMGRGYVNDPTDLFSQRGILAHEINHVIQEQAGLPGGGFAGGGILPATPGMQDAFKNQMIPQANKLRDFLQRSRDEWIRQNPGTDPEMWNRLFPEKQDALEAAIFTGGGRMPGGTTRSPPNSRFFEYESLAGEQAPRLSQEMMNWPAEQMQAESPYFKQSDRVYDNPLKPKRPEYLPPALQMITKGSGNNRIWSMPDLDFWQNNLDVRR